MAKWQLDGLWTEKGWLQPAWIRLDKGGCLSEYGQGLVKDPDISVAGLALPGFQNAHSHAFQYAMAGLAEHLQTDTDDFWSWRQSMYRLALGVGPDDMEAIAAMLYAEMLRQGYTAVAEFHYLHHDVNGDAYTDPAEMGCRLVAAAKQAGINLTLVPVYYQTGDFNQPASSSQRRFLFSDPDHYARHLAASDRAVRGWDRARLGGGIHSLRAVKPAETAAVFDAIPKTAPKHIHIAEQQREVDVCRAVLGRRPVEWLLERIAVDASFSLVHATHMTPEETNDIAASGATVVLCPSTEGNLGDGFFPLGSYLAAEGSWAIGSDSHIGLSPIEELRWLDYGRRLVDQTRNAYCLEQGQDSGDRAVRGCMQGGRRALGDPRSAAFTCGRSFDAVFLDSDWPLIAGTSKSRLLSTFVYAGDPSALLGTVIGGEWVVKNGRHFRYDAILASFRKTLTRLALR